MNFRVPFCTDSSNALNFRIGQCRLVGVPNEGGVVPNGGRFLVKNLQKSDLF